MLRMAHRIAVGPTVGWDGFRDLANHNRAVCLKSSVVIADNVAEHFADTNDPSDRVDLRDLVSLKLPLSPLFVEYLVPQRFRDIYPDGVGGFDKAHGVCLQSVDRDRLCTAFPQLNGWRPEADSYMLSFHWVLRSDGIVEHIPMNGFFALNEAGAVLAQRRYVSQEIPSHNVHAYFPAFYALSFMHCKNVVRRDVTETEGPSAKWLRRQKAPEIRYHVLDINPMKEVLRTEGGIESNGLKKALHICRGHFVTYTEERPLFGKITGTFWKPSHVRGSVEHGVVDKDYRIKFPK